MKKSHLVILLISLSIRLSAQEEYLQQEFVSLPPSPTSASLGEFNIFPNTLFTGTPTIGIPLFEINEEELHLPLSLSYNAKGVRVTDQGGWVGLSWNLICGGSIERTVHGKPDETYGGFLETKAFFGTKLNDDDWSPRFFDNEDYCDLLYSVTNSNSYGDLQPDQFNFSCGGYSGYFVFGHGKDQILTVPYQNIRVEVYNYGHSIDGFEITTPDGLTYCFGNIEINDDATEVSSSWSRTTTPSERTEYNSSWHLTRIKNSSGQVLASFLYEDDEEYTEIVSHRASMGPLNMGGSCEESTQSLTTTYHKTEYSSKKLSGIITKNAEIEFVCSDRTDVLGIKLDSIKIYETKGAQARIFKKGYTFSYEVITQNDRFFLTSVKEFSSSSQNRVFGLDYYSSELLPTIESFEQDLWGYYNDNDAEFLIPNIGPSGWNTFIESKRADRSTNPVTVTYGMLKKITYPTGGHSEYTFESNKVDDPNISTLEEYNTGYIGGVRIAEVRNVEGENEYVHTYEYSTPNDPAISSGTLFSNFNFYNEYEIFVGVPCIGLMKNLSSSSRINLTEFAGAHYGYQYITEYISENGTQGKILYEYDTYDYGITILGDIVDGKLKEKSIYENQDNVFQEVLKETYTLETFCPRESTVHSYKVEPTFLNTICGGSPGPPTFDIDYFYIKSQQRYIKSKSTTQYNATGYVTLDEEYEMSFQNSKPKQITKSNGLGGSMVTSISYPFDCLYPEITEEYEECLDSRDVLLKAAQAEYEDWDLYPLSYPNYDYSWDTGDYMDIYNQAYSLNACESDFYDNIEAVFQYGDAESKAIVGLVYQHKLSPVIERIVSNDSKIVEGGRIDYCATNVNQDIEDWIIEPLSRNSLSIEEPYTIDPDLFLSKLVTSTLPDGTINDISYGTNPDYISKEHVISYNENGNPTEISSNGNLTVAYLWGYNDQHLIARAMNVSADEIAYSGFESANINTGDWVVGYGTIQEDGHTGNYCLEDQTGNYTYTSKTIPAGAYELSMYLKNKPGYSGGAVTVFGHSMEPFWPSSDGWNYNTRTITLSQAEVIKLTITDNLLVDDIRLHPVGSQMTTYTYDPLIGMTSETDPNGKTTYYEYDDFGRLIRIKDSEGNLLQETNYNYANQ